MKSARRVMGIDLGEKTIGLALSDSLGLTAQPLEVYARIGPRKDLQYVAARVGEHDVGTVIVGLPLMMSGEEGEAARAARAFAERLAARLRSAAVEVWDERLTTVEAERALIAGDVRRRKRRGVVDKVAAALILQSYLDAHPRAGTAGG